MLLQLASNNANLTASVIPLTVLVCGLTEPRAP